jgi:hypothetical protein
MIKQIKEKLLHYSWDLAYGHYSESMLKNGLAASDYHIVGNPYKNKWFADPFIYKESPDQLELFVEEFDYSIGRGRIGHLVISKKSRKIVKLSIILERNTHLSFPAIYRVGNEVYVHPENSASGKSYMYRYDETLDRLVEPVEVLDEPVTDAIIREEGGHFTMCATKVPVPNGKELFVYQADSLFGPYRFKEKIAFDKAYARMAGAMIVTGSGEVIRPAQDCDGGDYGQAVHFMSEDRVIVSLTPPMKRYAGIHTFNTLGDTFIVDLKRYDYPWLYRMKTRLK